MGRTPLLEVTGLGKRFGGFVALENVYFNLWAGERLGLIGPNGSGKSTLVNCLTGTLSSSSGSVRFDGRALDGLAAHERTRVGLVRSFQLPRPFTSLTVSENVRVPILYAAKAHVDSPHPAAAIDERCAEVLRLVGLDAKARRLPRELTQIETRKLELARAVAAEPRLLIADEAMAGLSYTELDDIVALLLQLNERGVTIIMIEHIMRAVMRFSERIVVLVAGRKIADGKPDEVMHDPDVVKAYIGS